MTTIQHKGIAALRSKLLAGTVPPAFAIGIGIALASGALPDAVPFAASEAHAQCSACNPCNPCNPCAGGAGLDTGCEIPRLVVAAACNPCAAAACNPCAAAACNPCAAAACNPCNPCAAAAEEVTLTDAEATAAYDCVKGLLKAGYVTSNLTSAGGLEIASGYQDWSRFSTRPYQSATHGGRQVQNYANAVGQAYGKFEESGPMPVGSVLAKDSFLVKQGKVLAGPLFVMEKMSAGFNEDSGNWRYTMVMPDGKIAGTTNGDRSKAVQFCVECHAAKADTDHRWFLPSEYRVQ